MFNPIAASANIKDEYVGYISTLFHIADREYQARFQAALTEEGAVAKGPYLDISDSFRTGSSVEQLIQAGIVSPLFRTLEGDGPDGEKELKIQRPLYLHQEQAVRRASLGQSLVVTTGTGSGKTECFTIPIVNHLLREAEAGTLGPGVRAILIYPMNALANDQMKRLRALLKARPDITFGVYNGSTPYREAEGIAAYGELNRDAQGRPLRPCPNEILSRDRMRETPPNILVTNYAMLEYLLLRPKDDAVFAGAQLRFLVLDEAHIYRGATGMETAVLLRRLKARISDPDRVIHILTSATLGGREADGDIVKFAQTLCCASFREENIIRSETVPPAFPVQCREYPAQLFAQLAAADRPLNEITADFGLDLPPDMPAPEFLYRLCVSCGLFRDLRALAVRPMTIPELTDALRKRGRTVTEQEVVDLIHVASMAVLDKTALIKARYHMFAKALEGAYITLKPEKRLILSRNRTAFIQGENWAVFEAATCDDCGRLAVAGRISEETGKLEFAAGSFDPDMVYFLLLDHRDTDGGWTDEALDETDREDFLLCAKCGAITHKSRADDLPCGCGREHYVPVRRSVPTGERRNAKCPCCGSGKFKTFYLGYNAATAVLGTSLYEELPETERRLQRIEAPVRKSKFGAGRRQAILEPERKARQFLSFSDSRSEAAYFATYMTDSYQEFLRRRGIWHVVEKNRADMARHPWEISAFVDELTGYFDTCRTFAPPGDTGRENLTQVSRRNAWMAVLNEMVNARRSTSLVSLGIIRFQYKGNTPELAEAVADGWNSETGANLTPADAGALLDLLVMDIVHHGALKGNCTLSDDERKYIYYTAVDKLIKLCRDGELDKNNPFIAGWCASARANSFILNGRVRRLMDILGCDANYANTELEGYWRNVLLDGDLRSAGGSGYYFTTDSFTITAGTEDSPIYRCSICGRTTMSNCKNRCPTIQCPGTLTRISHADLIARNHYAKLYQSQLMHPLHIREHSAQLGREEQTRYQEMFIKKEINALSCSTTFEMGVDVGDLETVYLRNMPPSPANYAQRAGRAGRSVSAAAFSLTYAKLGSHDFTFYKRPEDMITGKIGVPVFSLRNEKVLQRHIFAVALSDFFSKQPDVYDGNNADTLLSGDGYERLCAYLNSRPEGLKRLLEKSIPAEMHQTMGISDYSWTQRLIGKGGALQTAVEDFWATADYYRSELERLKKSGSLTEASEAERTLNAYLRRKDTKNGRRNLIEFLTRNNVLPKYGFPVDTAELYQNTSSRTQQDLQMVRDLQIAISEYAPNAQVVADGRLFTSRYIRKLPQAKGPSWESAYVARCDNPSCQTWNHRALRPGPEGAPCVSCRSPIPGPLWRQAIEPRRGFIAESDVQAPSMRGLDRSYRSDDYYIGDQHLQSMNKFSFVNGEGVMLHMETSENDSLMVVCNDEFYVCSQCGYALSASEGKAKKAGSGVRPSIKVNHTSPWGKSCTGALERNKLCHVFKSDVVRLTFTDPQAAQQDVMLSVMYALLEAMSAALDIERSDIKGCLHKVMLDGQLIHSIVLYDAVAGGAGHVRRLATKDGKVFMAVVQQAIALTKGCTCSPSCYGCLRNYYNQTVHDKLNRKYAYSFLESFASRLEPV